MHTHTHTCRMEPPRISKSASWSSATCQLFRLRMTACSTLRGPQYAGKKAQSCWPSILIGCVCLRMSWYVCAHVYVDACTLYENQSSLPYLCVCVFVHASMCVCVCMHVSIYLSINVFMYVGMCVHMCTFLHRPFSKECLRSSQASCVHCLKRDMKMHRFGTLYTQ
jgi:hypothetical protein